MTLMRHELRQGKTAFALWTASIAFLLAICIFLFPEMKGEMEAVGRLFAAMGSFTAAFGMDRLNFGTLTGFYAIECGTIASLGGALFASLTGACALSREEQDRTADFLLTHPIPRRRVVTEKLLAAAVQILSMDLILLGLSLLSIKAIKEAVPWRALLTLHLSYLLLHLELACICFGISAFLRRGAAAAGLGLAAAMYCLNLAANMANQARFLKYLTPFAYCEGADILSQGGLDVRLAAAGMLAAAAGILAAYLRYCSKDIR